MDFLQGEIFAVDKPYGKSSFGALAHVRYVLSHRLNHKVKIGHAGTLDPLATGVLVLCTGKCTKQIENCSRIPRPIRLPCSSEPPPQATTWSIR